MHKEQDDSLYELTRDDFAIRNDKRINLIYQNLDDDKSKKWLGSNIEEEIDRDIDWYYD